MHAKYQVYEFEMRISDNRWWLTIAVGVIKKKFMLHHFCVFCWRFVCVEIMSNIEHLRTAYIFLSSKILWCTRGDFAVLQVKNVENHQKGYGAVLKLQALLDEDDLQT